MNIPRTLVVTMVALSLAASSPAETSDDRDDDRARVADHARLLDGVWISDGYGYAVRHAADRFEFYHLTSDICIAADVSESSLQDVFDCFRLEDDGRTLFLSTFTEPNEIRFDRATNLPGRCDAPPPPTPEATVHAVISYMEAHYAFFVERSVDWETMKVRLREAVPKVQSDDGLFDLLSEELGHFNDAHVELTRYLGEERVRFDADPGIVRTTLTRLAEQNGVPYRRQQADFIQDLWVTGVGEVILHGEGHAAGNDRIRFGMASDRVGYIAVRSMGGFIGSDPELQSEQGVFERALDGAMTLFAEQKAEGVIVDLSINSGGYDFISRQLAERFAQRPTHAYGFYPADARIKQMFEYSLEPSGRPGFAGDVFVLASRAAVSAAELAIMALDAIDTVTIVGETSRGALSTKLAKLLPNGWELTLSNQVYLDHEGQPVEAVGVVPDIAFDVFVDDDLPGNHLAAVRRTIEIAEQR